MSDHWISDLSLIGVERKRIRSLVGFRRGHRLPDTKSPSADAFVGRIAEPELQDDLETRFRELREAFAFKRRDLTKQGPEGGLGMLSTPAFDYAVSIRVDADDLSCYRFERRVTNIRDEHAIDHERFDNTFQSLLNSVAIPAQQPIDVEAVIDTIEDADPDELILDYNADATECRVQPRGTNTTIIVTADELSVFDAVRSPSLLLQTAIGFRRQFVAPGDSFASLLDPPSSETSP